MILFSTYVVTLASVLFVILVDSRGQLHGSLYNLSSILVLYGWKNWSYWLVGPILGVGPLW
jgi:hypothetical protein